MGARILVVEDERVTRKNICEFLRQEGYEVNEAPDEAQALEMLRKGRFDLIICDFILPKLHGLNLVEHVHSFSPKIPVVFVTAYLSTNSAKALLGKQTKFIQKPFQFDALLSAVQRLLNRKTYCRLF